MSAPVSGVGSKLGRPEIRRGVNPLMTKLWFRVGMARALQLSLAETELSADEAPSIGLVDREVPEAELMIVATEQARRISDPPLAALLAVKKAARTVPFMDVRAAIDHEFALTGELVADPTLRQSLQA